MRGRRQSPGNGQPGSLVDAARQNQWAAAAIGRKLAVRIGHGRIFAGIENSIAVGIGEHRCARDITVLRDPVDERCAIRWAGLHHRWQCGQRGRPPRNRHGVRQRRLAVVAGGIGGDDGQLVASARKRIAGNVVAAILADRGLSGRGIIAIKVQRHGSPGLGGPDDIDQRRELAVRRGSFDAGNDGRDRRLGVDRHDERRGGGTDIAGIIRGRHGEGMRAIPQIGAADREHTVVSCRNRRTQHRDAIGIVERDVRSRLGDAGDRGRRVTGDAVAGEDPGV